MLWRFLAGEDVDLVWGSFPWLQVLFDVVFGAVEEDRIELVDWQEMLVGGHVTIIDGAVIEDVTKAQIKVVAIEHFRPVKDVPLARSVLVHFTFHIIDI